MTTVAVFRIRQGVGYVVYVHIASTTVMCSTCGSDINLRFVGDAGGEFLGRGPFLKCALQNLEKANVWPVRIMKR